MTLPTQHCSPADGAQGTPRLPEGLLHSGHLAAATNPEEVAKVICNLIQQPGGLTCLAQAFQDRAAKLGATSPPHELSAFAPTHRGIFGPETSIRPSIFSEPIILNDPELYGRQTLVKALEQFLPSPPSPELLRQNFANIALWAQGLYFDSFRSSETSPGERQTFLMNHGEDIPLAALRGKKFAQCAERAPAFTNLMSVLGFDVLTVASMCTLGSQAEMHTFNLVESRGRLLITDPTNPVIWRYSDGRRSYSLATYEVPRDQIAPFMNGGEITVIHHDFRENGPETFAPSEGEARVYRGPRTMSECAKAFHAQFCVKAT